jgi:hypothetical protein
VNETGQARGEDNRGRLLIVAATVVMLGALIAAVLILSGDDEAEFASAPADCLGDWNADPAALFLGRHQFDFHRYQRVEVRFLTPDGAADAAAEGEDGATCAIVFAAAALDPEPSASVQILRPVGWAPLSGAGTPTERLAELQQSAQESYNAILQPDGSIDPR